MNRSFEGIVRTSPKLSCDQPSTWTTNSGIGELADPPSTRSMSAGGGLLWKSDPQVPRRSPRGDLQVAPTVVSWSSATGSRAACGGVNLPANAGRASTRVTGDRSARPAGRGGRSGGRIGCCQGRVRPCRPAVSTRLPVPGASQAIGGGEGAGPKATNRRVGSTTGSHTSGCAIAERTSRGIEQERRRVRLSGRSSGSGRIGARVAAWTTGRQPGHHAAGEHRVVEPRGNTCVIGGHGHRGRSPTCHRYRSVRLIHRWVGRRRRASCRRRVGGLTDHGHAGRDLDDPRWWPRTGSGSGSREQSRGCWMPGRRWARPPGSRRALPRGRAPR